MENIQNQVNLAPYNTFGVPCLAKEFFVLRTPSDLKEISKLNRPFFLGLGANTLFVSPVYDGLVIKNELKGRRILSESNQEVILEVASGENWIDLVNWVVENGWSGIENLAYIPGSVGAAPIQNLAAYGQNFGETVVSVTGLNLETKKIETLSYADCHLYYRDSIFKHELKNKFIITSIKFKLSKVPKFDTRYYGSRPYESLQGEIDKIAPPPYTPKIIAQAVTNQRKINLPDWKKLGTTGSFFKNPFVTKKRYGELSKEIKRLQMYPINKMLYPNPNDPVLKMTDVVKIPAGRLLDELGWRGKRIGQVGTFEKHALVVVNYGGATGQEILDFASQMRQDLNNHFAIDLEPEVNIIK